MGGQLGDESRDGRPDIYVSNMYSLAASWRVSKEHFGDGQKRMSRPGKAHSLEILFFFQQGPQTGSGSFLLASGRDSKAWSWEPFSPT
jgi:hypothetical protein